MGLIIGRANKYIIYNILSPPPRLPGIREYDKAQLNHRHSVVLQGISGLTVSIAVVKA